MIESSRFKGLGFWIEGLGSVCGDGYRFCSFGHRMTG